MDRTEMIEQVASQIYVRLMVISVCDPQAAAEQALHQAKVFANTILKAQQTALWPQIKTNGEPK